MALILNIDTATEHASACISKDGTLLSIETSSSQKDHAAFIQPAIQRLLVAAACSLNDLDAVAVSNGPGSYTGLRVGLSTAKGIVYALNKPLILLDTLEVIATAAIQATSNSSYPDGGTLYCPMIDARRMEVFTAVYDDSLKQVEKPHARVLDQHAFESYLSAGRLVISGSGGEKCKNIVTHHNAIYLQIQHDARHMQTIAEKAYLLKSFADKAYSEPFYLKEFFTPAHKLKSD